MTQILFIFMPLECVITVNLVFDANRSDHHLYQREARRNARIANFFQGDTAGVGNR